VSLIEEGLESIGAWRLKGIHIKECLFDFAPHKRLVQPALIFIIQSGKAILWKRKGSEWGPII